MRIVDLREFSTQEVFALRRRSLPNLWQVPYHLWQEKGFGSPHFAASMSVALRDGDEVEGYILMKFAAPYAPAERAYIWDFICVDADAGYELLQEAVALARESGVSEIRFGEDAEHLFCGLPVEFGVQRQALLGAGFEIDQSVERVDLLAWLPRAGQDFALRVKWIDPHESEELLEFVQREFPGRWSHDVAWMNQRALEAHAPSCTVGLFDERILIGFAVAQLEAHPFRCGGANWAGALGPGWSALGPLGLASSHRGEGCGNVLMLGTMCLLQEQRCTRCMVDWTSLSGFYQRFGFRIWKRYHPCALAI